MKLFQIMQRNKTGIAGALQVPFMENEAAHNYIIECIVKCYQHDYGMMPPEDVKAEMDELLEDAAKKRGFLVSRGEYDIERMANTLLTEYHSGKLGRLTLEMPPA